MLTIRLTRVGKPKQPLFRFIVSEKARDPWGKALELLGTANFRKDVPELKLETERIKYWLSKGAQCSDSVWNILLDQKIVEGTKRIQVKISVRRKEKLAKKAAAK